MKSDPYMSVGFMNQKILICREHIASVQKQEAESTVSPVTINLKIGFLPCSVASILSLQEAVMAQEHISAARI